MELEKEETHDVSDSEKGKAMEVKPHKLFISHSSKDADYMVALTEMLEDIGMPDGRLCAPQYQNMGFRVVLTYMIG